MLEAMRASCALCILSMAPEHDGNCTQCKAIKWIFEFSFGSFDACMDFSDSEYTQGHTFCAYSSIRAKKKRTERLQHALSSWCEIVSHTYDWQRQRGRIVTPELWPHFIHIFFICTHFNQICIIPSELIRPLDRKREGNRFNKYDSSNLSKCVQLRG